MVSRVVSMMSKSSGSSLANGNSKKKTISTASTASSASTSSSSSNKVNPRKQRTRSQKLLTTRLDPIEQTIEEVIARSLVESQQSSFECNASNRPAPTSTSTITPTTNAAARKKAPEMRQKPLPQKRKSPPVGSTANMSGSSQHQESEIPTTSAIRSHPVVGSVDAVQVVSAEMPSLKSATKVANGKPITPATVSNGRTPMSHTVSPVRILPKPSASTVALKTESTVTPPTDKLTGLLAKKRKWTVELSPERPVPATGTDMVRSVERPLSRSPTRKIDTTTTNKKGPHTPGVPVVAGKKRKLEALMHKRGQKSVWSWRGKSFIKTVYSKSEKKNMERTCYQAVRHEEGEVIKVGDCVLLRAPKGQEPHVGKVAAFWVDERGDMMMTIFWFWRPEEVDISIRPPHGSMEVFVSSLRDENFVSCIDEKCFVLTAHQYARFMAISKEDDTLYHRPKRPFVPSVNSPINALLPDAEIDPEIVYFANKGFDGKSNRFWDYYFRGNKLRKSYLD